MTSARAAINAALEAARAASGRPGGGGGMRRPAPEASVAAPAAAPLAAPVAPPTPSAGPSQVQPQSPAASAVPGAAPPWDNAQPRTAAQSQAQSQPQTQPHAHSRMGGAQADDEPPSWVTEFSDDTALASDAPAVAAAPVQAASAPVRAPAAPPHAYVLTPVPALGWDGNWPVLAASLPLRGVSQQLALQTELIECVTHDNAATFRLRVPVDTLRASGNSEKLTAALQEHFPQVRVALDTELGPTWYTAAAEAKANREERQRQAEAVVAGDPFVQAMEQTFGAFVVPGSVKPAAPAA